MRSSFPEAEVTRSLSNLYKPWFVHTESQNTRVIDSNDHIQEFLKQQMVKQDRPVGPDGFAEGIITCLLYTSPSPRDGATSRMPSSA